MDRSNPPRPTETAAAAHVFQDGPAELNDRVLGLLMCCRAGRQRIEPRGIADALRFVRARSHREIVVIKKWFRNRREARFPSFKGKDFLSPG
jgi:hypothetical protein